jgi:nicotinamidase-related amidase
VPKYYVYGEQRDLPETPEFAAYFDPSGTAVVSIDMHEGHLSEEADCPCPAPRGRLAISAINAFHDRARDLGVPIVHVVTGLRPSGIDDAKGLPAAWRITMPEYYGPIPGMPGHGFEGSKWTELRTESHESDEFVRNKKRLSAFYPTDLDFLLRQMGIRTVVITGIMTDVCVLNSSFDASNLNYRVVVPKETTRGTDDNLEAAALSIISLYLGVVTDTEELLGEWSKVRGGASPDVARDRIAVVAN